TALRARCGSASVPGWLRRAAARTAVVLFLGVAAQSVDHRDAAARFDRCRPRAPSTALRAAAARANCLHTPERSPANLDPSETSLRSRAAIRSEKYRP